jgi:hypothetical protein
MKSLHTNMKEMEGKKRVLEEAVDALNEEMSKVRAEGKLSFIVETCSRIVKAHALSMFTPHPVIGGF